MNKNDYVSFLNVIDGLVKKELDEWRFKENIGVGKKGTPFKYYTLKVEELKRIYVQALKLSGRYHLIHKRVFKKRLYLEDVLTGNAFIDDLLKGMDWIDKLNNMECKVKQDNNIAGGKEIPLGSLYIHDGDYNLIVKEEWTTIEK